MGISDNEKADTAVQRQSGETMYVVYTRLLYVDITVSAVHEHFVSIIQRLIRTYL